MTGGRTVFQEVDRSVRKLKFQLKSKLKQTEKRALSLIIYQIRREEISVLRLFQFELIGKWTSGNQSRTSTFLKAFVLKDECLFWKSLDPALGIFQMKSSKIWQPTFTHFHEPCFCNICQRQYYY